MSWPLFEDGDVDSDEEEKSPVKSPAKKRGGTDGNSVATQKGSAMIIHACPQGDPMFLETPSLANEFFEQLNASTAPN